MPIPPNIDLTEHSDFAASRNPSFHFIQIDSSVGELFSAVQMTGEEYEKLMAYENIFGRRRHYTDFMEVFMEDESEWIERNRCHCARCGKEIRIPWHRHSELCSDCDNLMEIRQHSDWESVFPWNPVIQRPRGNVMDIFSLR